MNKPHPVVQYCERICRMASDRKIGLRMAKTPTGWDWHWEGMVPASTTAHTQPVALYFACQEMELQLAHTQ